MSCQAEWDPSRNIRNTAGMLPCTSTFTFSLLLVLHYISEGNVFTDLQPSRIALRCFVIKTQWSWKDWWRLIHLKSVKTASRWPEVKNDQTEIRSENKCYHKHLNHSPNFTARGDVYQSIAESQRFSHNVTWTTWILFTVAWQRHQLLLDVSDWSSLSTN